MKLVASIVFGAVTFVGAFLMMPGPTAPFDYDTATVEDRQAFMDRQAKQMKRAARIFLPSGQGPKSLSFYLDEVVTRPERREIELIVRVQVPYGAQVSSLPRQEFMKRICGSYVKTQLYDHDVRMTTVMNHHKGQQLFKATVTKRQCDRYVETGAAGV